LLKHGRQVIISEAGHVSDAWNVQPEATLRLLTSFYDTGVAGDSLFRYTPMNFKVRLGFPLLAKILLGMGVMIVLGLVLGTAHWARRVRLISPEGNSR
jgi:hypothetical protein